jgi:hypothetical protein
MRKAICSLLLLLVLGFAAEVVTFDDNWAPNPLYNVVSQGPAGIEVIFSTYEVVIEEMEIDGIMMKHYGIPGMFLPNDEGAPNLAGTGRYITVPQGARAQLTVLDVRTEVYHNVEVAPAFNIPLESDDSPLRYEKDMAIYGRNAYFPSAAVKVSEPMQIRGVDVVILGITPFQYNPVTKDLIVYKDIRCRIDFIGGNGHFGEDRLRSRFWEPILQSHILNYASLPKIDFYAPERIQDQSGFEYIIIVPDDAVFEQWGDTIKAWRKLQGISCDVFTLTEIGGSTWQAIENFLNNAYNTWNPAPVAFLILSDYPSSGDVYGVTSPTWNSYCVSDNIYADVNGDNIPDMHHARICAQTETYLNRMVNKFLSYERSPYTASNFYDEPLIACAWQTTRWFQLCGEVIRGFWTNSLGKNPARQYALYSGTPTVGCPWSSNANTPTVVSYFSNLGYIPTTNQNNATWWNNGTSTGITNAINSGAFIVQHRDHGSETGWGEPYYTTAHLNNLTNTMFCFVYSLNCLTGKYNWGGECFTEKFHRIQYGAMGVNAASDVSYSFVNDTYIWGTYDCLWPQFMPDYPTADMPGHGALNPCMAMTYGKIFLQGSGWPYNPGNKIHTYHLFHHHGDAFNTLYSEMPQNLTVSHAATLPGGQVYFTVTANDSSIIALTVDGEIIGVDEGTGSAIDITISPQSEGDTVLVTITKANYYRYTALVPVTGGGATTPNVILVGYEVVGGNGNGILDPGEDAGIVCTIANIGSDVATNTSGTLRCADSYITITDSTTNYGTMQIQDTVDNSSDPFDVSVSTSCPPGHSAAFELYIACAESSWTENFNLIIGIQGEDYVTHDCGNVKLTVTRYGALGFMGSDQVGGSGFWYPVNATNHLYYGGFAAGTDVNYVVDRYYEDGTDDTDWETTTTPDGMARMFEPGPNNFDEYATARYDDSGHPLAQSLVCAQYSWAWDDATANDFVIAKFALINDGSSTITDLYATIFMDFDFSGGASDQGSSEAARNLAWMYNSTPYVGVAILDPPRSTPAVNLSLIDHALYVYPYSGLPDNIQIQFMDGTIQNPSSNRPYDWSTCTSAGPFTLAPGQAEIAAFAILGGDNLADLQANTDTAYNRYWNWPGVEETPGSAQITGIRLYPVISRGRPYKVAYGFAQETPVKVKVYDALGRLIIHNDYGRLNGSGEFTFDLKSMAQGVYFVKIEAEDKTTTSKIIWLK